MARSDATAAVSVERFFQFSLLGLVASGYLAVAGSGYLDTATIALTGAGLLVRALLIAGWLRLELSERLVTIVTLSYIAFFGLDYFLLSRDFLSATVHLVFFLAVMKILTAETNRDYLYTATIAFVELLAAAILSINFNFFLFLALFLLCAMATLTSAEIRRSLARTPAPPRTVLKRFHPRLALLTFSVTAGILVLTAGLFFVLPRTADAALSRLAAHPIHLPGFTNEVMLGEIGEIKITSRPIMHVQIFGRETQAGLKWRGAALTQFDGKRWSNPNPTTENIVMQGGHANLNFPDPLATRHLNYHVAMDVTDTDALFFAGIPETLDLRQPVVLRTNTESYRLPQLPPPGFRYDGYSRLENPPESSPPPSAARVMGLIDRQRYLQVPSNQLDPRIPELARTFAAQASTDLQRARAIERHLRSDYGYTLELPQQEVQDPLAYFLFIRKKGYCEYFASAMTIMLRTIGIPTRLVTGFQSGLYNPLNEQWVIRASDAHSWVEAWIPGYGWTTFDPTPPDPNPSFALLTRFGLYLDAAQTFWRDWVVSYDVNRQGALTDRVEQSARRAGIRWFDLWAGVRVDGLVKASERFGPAAVMALVVAAGLWLLGPRLIAVLRIQRRVRRVRRGRAGTGDATLLYQRMLHILQRRGYQKPPWFTPAEFAASLPPGLSPAIAEFTTTYNAWRFGGRTELAPRLSGLLDTLERPPSGTARAPK